MTDSTPSLQPEIRTVLSVSGFHTSEFWMTLLCVLSGLAMVWLGLAYNDSSVSASGTLIVATTAGAYSIGRGLSKRGP